MTEFKFVMTVDTNNPEDDAVDQNTKGPAVWDWQRIYDHHRKYALPLEVLPGFEVTASHFPLRSQLKNAWFGSQILADDKRLDVLFDLIGIPEEP